MYYTDSLGIVRRDRTWSSLDTIDSGPPLAIGRRQEAKVLELSRSLRPGAHFSRKKQRSITKAIDRGDAIVEKEQEQDQVEGRKVGPRKKQAVQIAVTW